MNKFALLPIFLILFFSTKAQDRIVSINHDTIHCTIVSINNERIMYELKNKNGSVTGRSMNLSQVAEYTRSPQSVNNLKPRKVKTSKPANIPENRWCLGLNTGRSTMPWYFDNVQFSSSMPGYYNKLKTGFHINANAHYRINSFFGVGAEYSFFNTNTSGSAPTMNYSSSYFMLTENYHQYINYLGPSILFQQPLDGRRKFILRESLSAGAMFIRLENQSTFPYVDYSGYNETGNNSLLTGNTLSAKLGLTAEYRIDRNLFVGFGGDFLWGSLKKADFKAKAQNNSYSAHNQKLDDAMNLSRIDYSAVLRYQF